jgi:DNA-binding transcriptional ArsR family regulator
VRQTCFVRTDVVSGAGFELLVRAAGVADPDWRHLLGGSLASVVAERLDGDLEVRLARVGRLGWLNLLPLLAGASTGHGADDLLAVVARTAPGRLHRVLLGGERRHVLDVVPATVVDRAAAGDGAARRELAAAYAGNRLVVSATDHVLDSPSARLHQEVVETLRLWAAHHGDLAAPGAETVLGAARRLRESGPRSYLEQSIPGLTYGLREDDHVVVVLSSALSSALASVAVVVDGTRSTVIAHSPAPVEPLERPEADASHLLDLARAVGDRTRMRILAVLREQDRTAVRLSEELGAPRTSLLHHLAILRSAGLVQLDVAPGAPTVYRLRPEGLRQLSGLAARFVSDR